MASAAASASASASASATVSATSLICASATAGSLRLSSSSWKRRRPRGRLGPARASAVWVSCPRLWVPADGICSPFGPAMLLRSGISAGGDEASAGGGSRRGRGGAQSRKMNFALCDVGIVKASSSRITPSNDDDGILGDIFKDGEVENNSRGISFLSKLAIALGIAATITLLSVCFKGPSFGSSLRFPFSFDGSSPLVSSGSPVGYTLSIFGCQVVLPEYTPGWIYFWLLMAAGCGIFISEEALNVWVGISLARSLSLDGTWNSFMISFSKNAPYIVSTVLWVYWGVCISDMIPFYLGRLFRQTKASVDICSKLGIGKDKVVSITRVVQKYGNMIGFVERFSVGARNPTSFLAGAWGIPSDCFFAGVCCGGLITLPVQLGIGFLLRERPAVALAGVATVVGIWTLLPYAIAASAALFMFLRQRLSS